MSEPAGPAPFVTLAELTSFMNTSATGEDETKLQEHLDAALEWVEARVGLLTGVSREYPVYATGRYVVLPVTHLIGDVTVIDPRGNTVTPRSIDRLAGIVEVPTAVHGDWTITASTREHGAAVKLAVKIIASHLWETQRGRGSGAPRDAMMAGGGVDATAGRGYAIPHRAADLLKPFLRSSF